MPNLYNIKRKIQKVLLIRPPQTVEKFDSKSLVSPLGLAYLAAVLEKKYQVKILDCPAEGFNDEISESAVITYGLKIEKIKKRIEAFSPDVVGISCLFSAQHSFSLKIASLAKDINPKIITVMGGAHPSSLPGETLENNVVDFVVIGEAEETFPLLLESIEKGQDYLGIDGIAYKKEGRIIINPKTRYIKDLDRIPFPARHLLPMEFYFRINRPHGMDTLCRFNTNMITSRGCPADCVFCSIHSVFGRNYRIRSVENVLCEIEWLKNNYGVREIQFEDDNLTLDKARAKALFIEMHKRNLDISWTAPNGVALWALDDELIELMKKSGCRHLALGIESGSEEVLRDIIGKPLKLKTVRPLLEKMSQVGIKTTSFFVVGFPGESIQQLKNTLKFAQSLPADDLNIFFATPYPGTRLYRTLKEANLLKAGFDFADLKVNKINILPGDIGARQLKGMVSRTIILFRLGKIIYRPRVFIFKWLKRFLKEPRQAFFRVKKLIRDSLSLPPRV